MKVVFYIFFFCLLPAAGLRAQANQQVKVSIEVADSKGEAIPYATIFCKELHKGGLTDSVGHFSLLASPDKTLHISVAGMSFQKLDTVIQTGNKDAQKKITLKSKTSSLKTVEIRGETHGAALTKKPIKAEVINTLDAKEQPTSLIELMNRSAGIRIRQDGALGSNSDVSLNGFQNRSIRYFKDGLPLNYLGAGFNISLIPVNMLDHVEVYKGVLPAYLGADALGGAINLVTRKSTKSYAEASYSFGSFNTHRVSLNAEYISKSQKYFAGVNAFYNYSKGDYKVAVQTTDTQTGTLQDVTAKLFHNRFSSYYAEAFAGVQHVKWADEFRVLLTAFSLEKQFQFGSTMFKPFGAAHGEQYSIVPAFSYKKTFLNNKLDLSAFAEINTLHTSIVDTTHGHYDWLGNFTPNPAEQGEITANGSLAKIQYHYFTSRINLSYLLSSSQKLDFNLVVDNFSRQGEDPDGKKFPDGTDFLSKPANYHKMAAALGLNSSFPDKKIENNLIAKFYNYGTEASDLTVTGTEEHISNGKQQWGVADGIKFNFSSNSQIQFSAETALRMPEQDEIFGDGNLKLANFNLKPERSLNFNLSYQTGKFQKYHFEANLFYRRTKDMILLVPLYFLNSQSQNVDNVRGAGFDADASYYLRPWLKVTGNLTYQDLRLVNTGNPTREDARLRNTPYFFGNLGLNAHFHHIVSQKDKLDVYWFYSFVDQYYLDYIPKNVEPDGFLGLWGNAKIDAQNIIPSQSLHTVGLTYYPSDMPLSFGFQIRNLFNARIYDNFKIQNPGRNFSIKISYSLF